MITVESTPPLVAILGNPVRFGLSTDNHIETAGAKAVIELSFGSTGSAGDYIEFAWNGRIQRFTCAADPDNSGDQIPDNSTIANLNDWVAAVAAAMALNYYIDRDYVVTVASAVITLTAREYGSEYVVSDTDVSWTDANNPTISITGSDRVLRQFFKIGLQLLIKSGATFEKIAEDLLPVDDNAEALFDVHQLFADRVYSEFKFPEASDQIMIARANQCREYRVRYFEQFGTDLTPQKLTESSSYYILAAGISTLQEAIYNRLASSLWDKLGYNQYFLTWSPKDKLIDRWSTEKLYYLVRSSIASLVLRIEINYNDETAQSTISKATVASPTDKGVYEIACSLNVLQLAGYDQDNIDYYRVWMEDGSSNRISEIRTFRMDYAYHENVRQFLFLNSLGGYDTLRITGDVEDSIELERTTMTRILGADYTETDHQTAQLAVTETKAYKANTGWLTKEQTSWIRDFFLSKKVFELVTGKLVPVVITTTQAVQRRDREDLYAIDFEYRRSYQSDYYSKEIVSAEFTDDFNDDFANE